MIDTSFDFQAEVGGSDSDRYSPTLQEYHRLLWSKPLPNGTRLDLVKISGNRLYHKSELGEFYLSSDRAVPTLIRRKSLENIIPQILAEKVREFVRLSDSIGGIVIWPSDRIGGKLTINGARGFNTKIADRLDLTIECIRRYYLGKESPLFETFFRYKDFFNLFGNFKEYVDFFLLQDAVSEDYKSIRIAAPFDNFESSPVPSDIDEYYVYMENSIHFVKARNERIADVAAHINITP